MSLEDLYAQSSKSSANKVGTFESVLAGIGSGLIGIPKGLFSLGATLMDLGVNSGKAAKVEQWFDEMSITGQKELISVLFKRRPAEGDKWFDDLLSRLDNRYHANKKAMENTNC